MIRNLKLHQTLQVKNICKQENVMLQLMLNPGLTLTGFQTTQSWANRIYILVIYKLFSRILKGKNDIFST